MVFFDRFMVIFMVSEANPSGSRGWPFGALRCELFELRLGEKLQCSKPFNGIFQGFVFYFLRNGKQNPGYPGKYH